LTILLHNLGDWRWPEEGLTLRSLWTRNKWRPYLDEELLTLLFLQLVGLRWGMHLRELFDDHLNTADGVFPQPEEGWRREIARARLYRFGEFFLPMVPSSASELAAGEGYGG